jgi:hypothetical protein
MTKTEEALTSFGWGIHPTRGAYAGRSKTAMTCTTPRIQYNAR